MNSSVTILINNSVSFIKNCPSNISNHLWTTLAYKESNQRYTNMQPWMGWKRMFDRKTCSFPTGLLKAVIAELTALECHFVLDDKRPEIDFQEDKIYFKMNEDFPSLRYYQEEAIQAIMKEKRGVLSMATGCHAAGTKILMYDGTKKLVEKIVVGDFLMGDDSNPREVLALHRGREEMYNVIPTKGDLFTVNESHILSLKSTNPGKAKRKIPEIQNISVGDYLKTNKNFKHLHKLYRVGIEFKKKDVVLDPYLLGCLLGDGSLTYGLSLTNSDEEVLSYIEDICPQYNIKTLRGLNSGGCPYLGFSKLKGKAKDRNFLDLCLSDMGLKCGSAFKFVPKEYRINSREVRLEILAGLLDTDGSLNNSNFDFISKSKFLAEDVVFLSRSLGLGAYLKPCTKGYRKKDGSKFVGTYWRVTISGDTNIIPTKVPRKQATPREQKKSVLKTGFKIEPIGVDNYYGFTVSGNHLYLMGDFTVTHNCGKSVIMMEAIKRMGRRTLYIVPKSSILTQAANSFKKHFESKHIGIIGGGKKQYNKDITVATFQSLPKVPQEFFDDQGALFIDEFHHCLASKTKIQCGIRADDVLNISSLYAKFNKTPISCPKVRSWDGEKWVFKKIINFFRYEAPKKLLEIKIKTMDYGIVILQVTDQHKIYTPDGKVMSGDLKVGDKVCLGHLTYQNAFGNLYTGEVWKTRNVRYGQKYVYDFEVEDTHNYVANGVLVSNSGASTYQDLNKKNFVNIPIRIGATATFLRTDGSDLAMQGVLSNVIYEYGVKDAITDGFLVKPYFFIKTQEHAPVYPAIKDWRKEYKTRIVDNQEFNERVAKIATNLQNEGHSTMIFIEEIKHGEILQELIPNSYFARGDQKKELNQDLVDAFNKREILTLIGTRLVGEGVDTVTAEYAIMAGSVKGEIDVKQRVGRLLRLDGKKKFAVIIDFYHKGAAFIRNHSKKRIELYKDYGTPIRYENI